jgi:chromosome segregation ATPase
MSSQILNLGPGMSDKVREEKPLHPVDDSSQLSDLLEQTRSDVRRIRTQIEHQEDDQEAHARRTKILSIVLMVLVLILVGAFWFAYPTLRDQQKATLEMLGLQNVANALGERMQSVESKLEKTSAGLPALSARMDQLGASMKSTLQTARSQAQTAATQVGQKIRADLTQSIQAVQSRMAGLESNQHESSERVNQLQEQIAGLKQELASVREESTAASARLRELQDDQKARASAISTLDQRMATHQTTLDSLSSRVDRKRVDFQLPTRRTEQIVPGIYLTIRRADKGKQEIDGTLQLGADSRMMPIRAQSIQKPMVFYSSSDSRPMELVITQVEKNQVSGYIVIPGPTITATRADNTQ